MSHNSRNRDIYEAKMRNATNGDPEKMVQMLMQSPFREHQKRAQRVLKLAELLYKPKEEGKTDGAV